MKVIVELITGEEKVIDMPIMSHIDVIVNYIAKKLKTRNFLIVDIIK